MNSKKTHGSSVHEAVAGVVASALVVASTNVVAAAVSDLDKSTEPAFAKAPATLVQKIRTGGAQEIVVQFKTDDIDRLAAEMKRAMNLKYENDDIQVQRRRSYSETKKRVLSVFNASEITLIRDYEALPSAFIRIANESALKRLLEDVEVKAVFENGRRDPLLSQGLPLIGQKIVAQAGHLGSGATVAVLDTGVDYNDPAFGSCTPPNSPGSLDCRVVYAQDFAPEDGLRDASSKHGTNVVAAAVSDLDKSTEPAFAKAPATLVQKIRTGIAQEVIVDFNADDVDRLAAEMKRAMGLNYENKDIRFQRRQAYSEIKRRVLSVFRESDIALIRDYSELPSVFIRVSNEDALRKLLADVEVKAVFENKPYFPLD